MAGMKKLEARQFAAKVILAGIDADIAGMENTEQLDNFPEFAELTKSGRTKVKAAFVEFKSFITKKAKLAAE